MKHRPLIVLSFGLALLVDAFALRALVGQGILADVPDVLEAAVGHLLAILIGGIAYWFGSPAPQYRSSLTSLALLLGLCLPMPVLGLASIATYRLLLRWRPSNHDSIPYVIGERLVMAPPVRKQEGAQSHRSVLDILRGHDNELRRNAVLALRSVDPQKALPVLQKALQDGDEQVRLLAQAQFNKILVDLELAVKNLEAELAAQPDSVDLKLKLAEHYNELVFLGLSSEETEVIYLTRAAELLHASLKQAPNNLSALFTLLKVQVKTRQGTEARATLDALRTLGQPPELLWPWEADLAFQSRDWAGVVRTLDLLKRSPGTSPRVRAIADFWLNPKAVD